MSKNDVMILTIMTGGNLVSQREKLVKLTGNLYATILVDPETGIEYTCPVAGGAITPLYNADGSLKINSEYKKNL